MTILLLILLISAGFVDAGVGITRKLRLSGKKPAELNIIVKINFRAEGNERGCKTKSKSGLFMVPLEKSKTYSINSIDKQYFLEVPMIWTAATRCIWNVTSVQIKMEHLALANSQGITGFIFSDHIKSAESFLGHTTIYCQRKFIEKDGTESKGISCRDENLEDGWVYYFNGFLNEEELEYTVDIVMGEKPTAPLLPTSQIPPSSDSETPNAAQTVKD